MSQIQKIVDDAKKKQPTNKTKKITIKLAAYTRVEYTEEVEVPVSYTKEDYQAIADQANDEIDGGEYSDDEQYWDQCDPTFEDS